MIQNFLYLCKLCKPLQYQKRLFIFAFFLATKDIILSIAYSKLFKEEFLYNFEMNSSFVMLILSVITFVLISMYIQKENLQLKAKNKQLTRERFEKDWLALSLENNLEDMENLTKGKWITYFTSDLDILSSFYNNVFLTGMQGMLTFIFAILYGLAYSVEVALTIFCMSLLSTIVPKLIQRFLKTNYTNTQISLEMVQERALETVEYELVVGMYQAEDFMIDKNIEALEKHENEKINLAKTVGIQEGSTTSIGFTFNTLWLILAMYFVSTQKITIGVFVGFMNLSTYYNWPFFKLPALFNQITRTTVTAERLAEIKKNECLLGKKAHTQEYSELESGIYIEHLSFQFYGAENRLIEDFSLFIPSGKVIVVAGESGKGKSSLLKLLLNLYEKQNGNIAHIEGKILESNVDLIKYAAYVPEESQLFSGTLRENLSVATDDITEDNILSVCKDVGLDSLISGFPKGLDTEIGKGKTKLSGGEKQLVALARALLKPVNILLLDENTSALDIESEREILTLLSKTNKTILMVSHRKSVLNHFSKIVNI